MKNVNLGKRKWAGAVSAAAVLAGVALYAAPARASIIASEPFGYNTGTLVGDNGGTGFSSAWSGGGTVVAGSLNYTDSSGNVLATSGNSANNLNTAERTLSSSFGSSSTQSTAWASVLWQPTYSGGSSYFGFQLLNGSTSNAFIGQIGGSSVYSLSLGGSNYKGSTVPDTIGKTALLVLEAQFDYQGSGKTQYTLYVNPTLGSTPPTFVAGSDVTLNSGSSANQSITGINFSVATYGSPPASINPIADEIRIGTTYADVTPVATPEPATLGILGLGGLGLLAKKRRKVA